MAQILYQMTLHIAKENRPYFFQVPLGVSYEEASEVAKEFAQAVLEVQQKVQQQQEELKLKEEVSHMQEAKAE